MNQTLFYLSTGETLTLQPGIPPGHTHAVMKGAESSHVIADFGTIVRQQIRLNEVSMIVLFIEWKQPAVIICEQQYYLPVFFTRMALVGNLNEEIYGAGPVNIPETHFVSLTGIEWTSALSAENPGVHIYIDLVYPEKILSNHLVNYPDFLSTLQNPLPFVPDRVIAPLLAANKRMRATINELLRHNYFHNKAEIFFAETMHLLLKEIIAEALDLDSVKEKHSAEDLKLGITIRNWIKDNRNKKFSTSAIAEGCLTNTTKVKKLVLAVTGCTADELRRYYLIIDMRNKVVMDKIRPSLLYEQAGFSSLSALIDGCRDKLCCTPGELKRRKWSFAEKADNPTNINMETAMEK